MRQVVLNISVMKNKKISKNTYESTQAGCAKIISLPSINIPIKSLIFLKEGKLKCSIHHIFHNVMNYYQTTLSSFGGQAPLSSDGLKLRRFQQNNEYFRSVLVKYGYLTPRGALLWLKTDPLTLEFSFSQKYGYLTLWGSINCYLAQHRSTGIRVIPNLLWLVA